MKASQLIVQLAQAITTQGDLDVVITNKRGEVIFDRCCVEYSIKKHIEIYVTKREV